MKNIEKFTKEQSHAIKAKVGTFVFDNAVQEGLTKEQNEKVEGVLKEFFLTKEYKENMHSAELIAITALLNRTVSKYPLKKEAAIFDMVKEFVEHCVKRRIGPADTESDKNRLREIYTPYVEFYLDAIAIKTTKGSEVANLIGLYINKNFPHTVAHARFVALFRELVYSGFDSDIAIKVVDVYKQAYTDPTKNRLHLKIKKFNELMDDYTEVTTTAPADTKTNEQDNLKPVVSKESQFKLLAQDYITQVLAVSKLREANKDLKPKEAQEQVIQFLKAPKNSSLFTDSEFANIKKETLTLSQQFLEHHSVLFAFDIKAAKNALGVWLQKIAAMCVPYIAQKPAQEKKTQPVQKIVTTTTALALYQPVYDAAKTTMGVIDVSFVAWKQADIADSADIADAVDISSTMSPFTLTDISALFVHNYLNYLTAIASTDTAADDEIRHSIETPKTETSPAEVPAGTPDESKDTQPEDLTENVCYSDDHCNASDFTPSHYINQFGYIGVASLATAYGFSAGAPLPKAPVREAVYALALGFLTKAEIDPYLLDYDLSTSSLPDYNPKAKELGLDELVASIQDMRGEFAAGLPEMPMILI